MLLINRELEKQMLVFKKDTKLSSYDLIEVHFSKIS